MDSIERLIFGLVLLAESEHKKEEATSLEAALKECVGEDRLKRMREDESGKRAALFESDFFLAGRDEKDKPDAIKDALLDLKRQARHERYRDLLSRLRSVEKEQDTVKAGELLKELSILAKTLD